MNYPEFIQKTKDLLKENSKLRDTTNRYIKRLEKLTNVAITKYPARPSARQNEKTVLIKVSDESLSIPEETYRQLVQPEIDILVKNLEKLNTAMISISKTLSS